MMDDDECAVRWRKLPALIDHASPPRDRDGGYSVPPRRFGFSLNSIKRKQFRSFGYLELTVLTPYIIQAPPMVYL